MKPPASSPSIAHIPEAEGDGPKQLVSGAESQLPEFGTPQSPIAAKGSPRRPTVP